MRIFNRQGTWRFRSSIIATAVISTFLVPAVLISTSDVALAAVDTHYCDSYSAYPLIVENDGNNNNGTYEVKRLNVASSASTTDLHDLSLPDNSASINAVAISPKDQKAYGILAFGLSLIHI